jgi:hypothetical protein
MASNRRSSQKNDSCGSLELWDMEEDGDEDGDEDDLDHDDAEPRQIPISPSISRTLSRNAMGADRSVSTMPMMNRSSVSCLSNHLSFR